MVKYFVGKRNNGRDTRSLHCQNFLSQMENCSFKVYTTRETFMANIFVLLLLGNMGFKRSVMVNVEMAESDC